MEKRKKKKKTLGNNQQTLYIKALQAFIYRTLQFVPLEEEDAL